MREITITMHSVKYIGEKAYWKDFGFMRVLSEHEQHVLISGEVNTALRKRIRTLGKSREEDIWARETTGAYEWYYNHATDKIGWYVGKDNPGGLLRIPHHYQSKSRESEQHNMRFLI